MSSNPPELNKFANPFRPGAGQKPLYLAGRTKEHDRFKDLLNQSPILKNLIITGLRGAGKTVLLENLKPIATQSGWIWVGNDLSESASLTEEKIGLRVVTDLTTNLKTVLSKPTPRQAGFTGKQGREAVEHEDLWGVYQGTPGLDSDKLKAVMQLARRLLSSSAKGIIFAYDEAQNLSDHSKQGEYPLSNLLDVFSSLQKDHSNLPIILVLTGLPTLHTKLNEARTYTERMFEVLVLDSLDKPACKDAIVKPIEIQQSALNFSEHTIGQITNLSGGYPYFIQYICKEVFDAWIGRLEDGEEASVPEHEIVQKLDLDFFSPRWDRASDRQRDFMRVVASLESPSEEFTGKEITDLSSSILEKGFTQPSTSQMLRTLMNNGFVYRNRHGKYLFAVPMMANFIRRYYANG